LIHFYKRYIKMTTERTAIPTENGSCDPTNPGSELPQQPEIELRPGGAGFQRLSRPPGINPAGFSPNPPPPGLGLNTSNSSNFDDLADAFAGGFTVTNTPNDTNRPHPRFAQFKMKGSSLPQDERRKKLLNIQKQRRDDLVNHARCLAMGEFEGEDEGLDQQPEEEEDMDTAEYRQRRMAKSYKKQLMLSEWLVEVPEDLNTNWILILCPEGRRNFVVASNGITKVYSKNGKQVKKFPSNIPGGSRNQNRRNSYSILDCIFSEKEKVFYILDMMCWDGFQYYDCDTEFRMSWVQQKFIENKDQLMDASRMNPYRFLPLPIYQCTPESIHAALNTTLPFQDKLDGLLIYHKHVHYMPGYTPLVGWLKGFMVPELLNIQVGDAVMAQKPSDYAGMKVMLKSTFERVEKEKKAKKDGEMETVDN
jgi:snurportin-1